MEEFVVLVMFGLILFLAGWHAREWYATYLMSRFITRFEDNAREALGELRRETIKIKIEKHEEGYFVYNLEDHGYMAQGKTRKELEENLSKRFPGKFFAAEEDNLIEVGFKS
jgi:predicted RNase H-like HicB family nuclease